MDEKYDALIEKIKALKKVAVAFSGGVDSSLLLFAAKEAVGSDHIAITIHGDMAAAFEGEDIKRFITRYDMNHLVISVDIDAIEGFKENSKERCYYCKRQLFTMICNEAKKQGIEHVLDGSNVDDQKDYRPGRRALDELHIISPLVDVGLTKSEIRALLKNKGMEIYNKPNFACLASRVPYEVPITKELLKKIDLAETWIRSLGFKQIRVRTDGVIARIEIAKDEMPDFVNFKLMGEVNQALKNMGFKHVAFDLEGYVTGSLND